MEDKFYKLREIADWQLTKNSTVQLPDLQRSFVWKPYQIETLWDSILRGFPVGAFLLAKSCDGSLFLMDGQQRATSISLGFYNPWEDQGVFYDRKISSRPPTVWIDLSPETITTTHKYLIKVLTRSHPWGYKSKNNQSILTVEQRRNALKKFKDENSDIKYTDLKNTAVYPIEANLPIPLIFLLDTFSDYSSNKNIKIVAELLLTKCIENLEFIQKDENLLTKYKKFFETELFSVFYNKIFESIQTYQIPTIVTKREILNESDENEDNSKDDPTLFVRLNSLGTTISGEELIYSIYKSEFPQTKSLVENIGADYIRPSSLISLFTRITWSNINDNKFPPIFNVNEFRRRLKENQTFKTGLIESIGYENNSTAKTVFDKAIEILTGEKGEKLPPVLIKSLINNSSDIFLLLLFWISKYNTEIREEHHLQIKKKFVHINLFCTDVKKFTNRVWSEIENINFWTESNFELVYKEYSEFIFQLPDPVKLKTILLTEIVEKEIKWGDFYLDSLVYYAKFFNNILDNKYSESEIEKNNYQILWDKLFNTLVWNKNLLIFAQRNYFDSNFKDYNNFEVLSDTNRPWDWDNIYPQSWVYNQKGVNHQIRDWHNMNGNMRAITLEENRSEGNHKAPNTRFEDNKKGYFFIKDDWEYWKEIDGRLYDDKKIKILINAVVLRTFNIYDEIYKFLR